MAHRYRKETVEVVPDATGAPQGFRWRGQRYRVRAVLAHWVEALPWWRDLTRSGGQRWCWRVEAVCPLGQIGVYDLSACELPAREQSNRELSAHEQSNRELSAHEQSNRELPAHGARATWRWAVDRVLD